MCGHHFSLANAQWYGVGCIFKGSGRVFRLDSAQVFGVIHRDFSTEGIEGAYFASVQTTPFHRCLGISLQRGFTQGEGFHLCPAIPHPIIPPLPRHMHDSPSLASPPDDERA